MAATAEPRNDNRSVTKAGATQSATATWTVEAIQALGTVTTVPVAASIFGLSRSVAYDLIRAGTFPVSVLRFGTRYRVPVRAILAALHMPTDPHPPDST
jgi:Helix-turn-helix domain